MPNMRSLAECEIRGFAHVAEKLLRRNCLKESTYRHLVAWLLQNRENTIRTPEHDQGLKALWGLALQTARFGADELDIDNGCSEFHVPPLPSNRLVKLGIIVDQETIAQIETRERARKRRGRPLPENRVIVKAMTPSELQPFGLGELRKPVLMIEEHYTVTVPNDPSVELDREGVFFFHQDAQGNPQLLFLGERQEPHAHAFAAGKWYRLDKESHPDFTIPDGDLPLPLPKEVSQPQPATNDQIATLLVLFTEGIKAGRRVVGVRL